MRRDGPQGSGGGHPLQIIIFVEIGDVDFVAAIKELANQSPPPG